jgi:peptide deformylase
MALLDIVLEGDPRLRQKATKIRAADESLRKLAADMHETMDDAPGVGLAGPQIGVMRRIIVVHVGEHDDGEPQPDVRLTLLNPEIVRGAGREVATEGCLSIPHWIGDVPRMASVTVKAIDLNNKPVRIKARGYLARVLQHEIDHLDGILFIDRVEDKTTLKEVFDEEEEPDEEVL